jgi:hypothetical protein
MITVSETDQEPVRCAAFGYRDVPGRDIQHRLTLKYGGATYPVDVYLKIAAVEVPGRTARFFARGRRVNQVAEIKSFMRKSAYRTSVWGHPHLLGYIEVGELVRPVITRDDFVRNQGRRIFYEAILDLEEEVKQALDRINDAQRDTTLSLLEDVLREVLESIARQDRRQLRLHTAAKRKKATRAKEAKAGHETIPSGSDAAPIDLPDYPPIAGPGPAAAEADQSDGWPASAEAGVSNGLFNQEQMMAGGLDMTRARAPLPGPDDEVKFSYNVENPQDQSQSSRRRSSFDIQFFDIPPDAEGQVKRLDHLYQRGPSGFPGTHDLQPPGPTQSHRAAGRLYCRYGFYPLQRPIL